MIQMKGMNIVVKYAGIIYNDFSAAPGVSLSFFTQGCHFRCKGCHNPETWDFNGGREFTEETLDSIINGLQANGINRNLCIMGGEPLCPANLDITIKVILLVKSTLPNTKIYLWTGYTYEQLLERLQIHDDIDTNDLLKLSSILSHIDVLIDGPYIEEERDITLFMRGSKNQRVIKIK